MGIIEQVADRAGWDVVADAVASTVGHGSPTHRAALDAVKGFPDAVDRFALHLENLPGDKRGVLEARLRAAGVKGRAPTP